MIPFRLLKIHTAEVFAVDLCVIKIIKEQLILHSNYNKFVRRIRIIFIMTITRWWYFNVSQHYSIFSSKRTSYKLYCMIVWKFKFVCRLKLRKCGVLDSVLSCDNARKSWKINQTKANIKVINYQQIWKLGRKF